MTCKVQLTPSAQRRPGDTAHAKVLQGRHHFAFLLYRQYRSIRYRRLMYIFCCTRTVYQDGKQGRITHLAIQSIMVVLHANKGRQAVLQRIL